MIPALGNFYAPSVPILDCSRKSETTLICSLLGVLWIFVHDWRDETDSGRGSVDLELLGTQQVFETFSDENELWSIDI